MRIILAIILATLIGCAATIPKKDYDIAVGKLALQVEECKTTNENLREDLAKAQLS